VHALTRPDTPRARRLDDRAPDRLRRRLDPLPTALRSDPTPDARPSQPLYEIIFQRSWSAAAAAQDKEIIRTRR
jgi:hypothetical protein